MWTVQERWGLHHFYLYLQINSYKSTAESEHLQPTDTGLPRGWPPRSSNLEGSPPLLPPEGWVCWSWLDSRSSRCHLWSYIRFHAPATSSCSLYQWLKWRDLCSVSTKDRFTDLCILSTLNRCGVFFWVFFFFHSTKHFNTEINKGSRWTIDIGFITLLSQCYEIL